MQNPPVRGPSDAYPLFTEQARERRSCPAAHSHCAAFDEDDSRNDPPRSSPQPESAALLAPWRGASRSSRPAGAGELLGCSAPVAVGGPRHERQLGPGRRVKRPCQRTQASSPAAPLEQLGRLPGLAVVGAELDLGDAAVAGVGDAGDRCSPGGSTARGAGVSMRVIVLTMPCLLQWRWPYQSTNSRRRGRSATTHLAPNRCVALRQAASRLPRLVRAAQLGQSWAIPSGR